MRIIHSKEIDDKKARFIKMSREQFDKYMCKTYPIMFKERNLPMSQTCMCWSFDIGKGWYWILADLCEKLEFICKQSKTNVIFTQIKEKFGGARFYYRTEGKKSSKNNSEYWQEIITTVIDNSEELCDYYCAECGEQKDDMISIGGWVYDRCEKCLGKDRKESLKWWKENKELKELILDVMYRADKEELGKLRSIAEEIKTRLEEEQKKIQEKYEKSNNK